MEIELDNAKLTRTIAERDTLQKTVNQLAAEAAVNKEKNEHALAVQKGMLISFMSPCIYLIASQPASARQRRRRRGR